MLLEYSCSNFKSIKDKVLFSLLAGADDTFSDNLIRVNNNKVLRTAIIYGPNGSGKSNFLNSLGFMSSLVANSIKNQPGQGVFQAPHKLATADIPSSFDIQFIKNDIRYAYGFSVLNNTISEEYLYYFPLGRKVKIFERKKMEVVPGSKYKKAFDVSMSVLKENRLFISCAANYSNVKEIEDAFCFFSQDIVVYNGINNWMEYSIELMQKNSKLKSLFVQLLQEFDTGIQNVDVKMESVNVTLADLPADIPQEIKGLLLGKQNRYEAKVNYGVFTTDLISEESDGIQKLFELLCPIIDIIMNGKILVCDEFEKNLHENFVYKLIELFSKAGGNKNAQLLLSTHDTSLLSSDLFRRDQIWFTQLRDADRSTDLYSLVELKNIRKNENLEKGYISGKYGAIPMLNSDCVDSILKSII